MFRGWLTFLAILALIHPASAQQGMGVPLDYVQGYYWIAIAAGMRMQKASAVLKTLESKMSVEQITKARKEAKKKYPYLDFPWEAKKK